MASLPAPSLTPPVIGLPISQSYLQSQVYNPLSFLLNPPIFKGIQTVTQPVSVTPGSFTAIAFDTETVDSVGGHSTTTNTSRYTVQVAGTYLVIGTFAIAGNAVGSRAARININGNSFPGAEVYTVPNASANTMLQVSTVVACAVGDYIELMGYQSSGGSLSTVIGSSNASDLSVVWISK